MSIDAAYVRKVVAAEAQKTPLQIQCVPRKVEPAEAFFVSLANMLLAGLLLMWGLRAAHFAYPQIPAAGYVDSCFVILGLNALGAALGWARVGVIR